MHTYEVRPGKDKRGVDLISDALPFGRLWYGEPNAVSNAIAVIRVYDETGNVIEMHEHKGEFKGAVRILDSVSPSFTAAKCGLCRKERPLRKSHVIPDSC